MSWQNIMKTRMPVLEEEGIRMKRERLNELVKRDSIELAASALQYETIGINLEKILKNPGSKYDLILQMGIFYLFRANYKLSVCAEKSLYPITVRYDEKLHLLILYPKQVALRKRRERKSLRFVCEWLR
ncbi:MAG: hypothetical protein U5K79_06960 [Cyclobacteriaceae bacterium]|nr:hypothetical protein [Cyclobacteriaceae bacterium]